MRAPRCSGPRRAPARVRSADVARGLPSSEPLADAVVPREVARDLALEEEPDQLAVARADLLADDDAEALSHLAQPERAGDDVVVGRADDVEARRTDRPGLFRERRAAVGRVLRMRVHVDAD